jgi:predicted lipoprotein with Yx(FWY)xxD motif
MRTALAAIALAAVVAAGCGSDQQDKAAPVSKTKPEPARGTYLKVRKTRYGRILTDGTGRALYLFEKEDSKRPECYGACAKAWPPFYARGKLKAGTGVKQSRIGVTIRREKRTQVTYNGHPLYYYVSDRAPGQVTCQNVSEYGGKWLVVSPSGVAIR